MSNLSVRDRLLNDPDIRQRISVRAFELYETQRQHGWDLDHWLQAENEILEGLIQAEQNRLQMQASSTGLAQRPNPEAGKRQKAQQGRVTQPVT